jgi:hypothetical protein
MIFVVTVFSNDDHDANLIFQVFFGRADDDDLKLVLNCVAMIDAIFATGLSRSKQAACKILLICQYQDTESSGPPAKKIEGMPLATVTSLSLTAVLACWVQVQAEAAELSYKCASFPLKSPITALH